MMSVVLFSMDSTRGYEQSNGIRGGNTNPLISCLDAALDSYGESVKFVVYWNLQKKYNIEKSGIPDHPDEFVAIIESIFGIGADFVKDKIILSIQQHQLGGSTEKSLEMVRMLRKSIGKSQNKK